MSNQVKFKNIPSLLLIIFIITYTAWFSFLALRRYAALDTGGYDLGNMDQAVWNTLRGRILQETNVEGIDTRLAHHVEPILILMAPLYLLYSSPRTLLVVQTIVIALGALPVYALARRKLSSEFAGLAFALAYLLYPALQAANVDEFHTVSMSPTFILAAYYILEIGNVKREDGDKLRGMPHVSHLTFYALLIILALMCKEDVSLGVILLGAYIMLRRAEKRIGAATALGGLIWFYVAVYVVIPHFNPQDVSPFLAYYENLGDNPIEMGGTLLTNPRLMRELVFNRHNFVYLAGLTAPFAFLSLLDPLMMACAAPSVAICLLGNNEWMKNLNLSHHPAASLPFFVLATIGGAAWLNRRVGKSTNRQIGKLVSLVVLCAALIYHRYNGFTPLAIGFRPVPLTAHHQMVHEFTALIPADASVCASQQVNSQVSQRRELYLFPHLHDADFIFLDVTPTVHPLIVQDIYNTVHNLLREGKYGVRAARDGYLLLASQGITTSQIPDEFYTFARAAPAPEIAFPHQVRYDGALEFLGYDLVPERTATAYLTLYFRGTEPIEKDYRFFVFFLDADGNIYKPALTAPIRYPSDQQLVAPTWYSSSQWQPGEVIRVETTRWVMRHPAQVSIALAVIDGDNQWELSQRVAPEIFVSDAEVVQNGTMLRLLTLRSDGRRIFGE